MRVNNVVPNKLHQELIDAGVDCSVIHNLEDGRYFVGDCEIKFTEDTDMELAQQIIEAHESTPLSKLPTAEERLKQAEDTILYLLMNGGI